MRKRMDHIGGFRGGAPFWGWLRQIASPLACARDDAAMPALRDGAIALAPLPPREAIDPPPAAAY